MVHGGIASSTDYWDLMPCFGFVHGVIAWFMVFLAHGPSIGSARGAIDSDGIRRLPSPP